MILDISGSGLLQHASPVLHILGEAAKLIFGSFAILLFAIVSFVAVITRSVLKGVQTSSVLIAFRSLLRWVAYVIGISFALTFMLLVSTFFAVSFVKLLLISAVIALVVSFVAKETFWFLIFKRFGKYIFYLTTLHRASKVVYNYVKTEKDPIN
jgi:hypothetical protein